MSSSEMVRAANSVSLGVAAEIIAGLGASKRVIAALAGPPGSGKSTAAQALRSLLNSRHDGFSQILMMDGFHYDDAVLRSRGLLERKGAPETFDVAGLVSILGRLREEEEPEVAVPVFDRDLEISRGAADIIASSARCVIVEGNYLLLRRAPWDRLRPFFDVAFGLKVERDILRRRLVDRWNGYDLPVATVEAKVEQNDLPNADLVLAEGLRPDYWLST